MPLRIYLDDSRDVDLLIVLLQNAGHTVISPRAVGTMGQADSVHLEYAARRDHILLTADIRDFQRLHMDWRTQGRMHAGMFFVHYEGDATKDMKPQDIVHAIANLIAANVPIANEIHRLNHWR